MSAAETLWEVTQGDCRSVLADFDPDFFDACVTDPPYELGFMGKDWDRSGVAVSVDTWAAVLRVLKPGAHIVAFGGTRTWHRIACAIEDAGFQIRDNLAWLYGQGFPKSLNLPGGIGTALKPSFEPIILARKPPVGTIAANVGAFGVGGLNIGACRTPAEEGGRPLIEMDRRDVAHVAFGAGTYGSKAAGVTTEGRWPPNVCVDEAVANAIGDAARFFYCPKANGKERDAGLEAAGWPALSGGEMTDRTEGAPGATNPRAGAGRGGGRRNPHPTVKPIALMRWLCKLITPPGGTVLDPFTGSGTTGCAAGLEGFDFWGVELGEDYAKLARDRIAAALTRAL
jgi:hypothetical protein